MKQIPTLLLAAAILSGCSHSDSKSYTVSGEIEGLPDSTELILSPVSHGDLDTIGRATVIDGKFSFEGVAEEPMAVNLIVSGGYGHKMFMLENGEIRFKGKTSSKEASDGKMEYDFEDIEISGSPLTDTLNMKMEGRYRINTLFDKHYETYGPLMEQMAKAREDNNRSCLDSIMSSQTYKDMADNESHLFSALDSTYRAAVSANRNTFWGPVLMMTQVTYLSPEQREIYETFSEEAKNSFHGRQAYAELYPVGRPGDRMPEFSAQTLDGSNISFGEFCKGKKLVLLDFWASWCRPCRAEIPNLKKIYEAYAGKGFDIVSISIDQDDPSWKLAVEKEGLVWTQIRDTDKSIAGKYNVSSVPTIYLVDSEGCLVAENLRGEELAKKVEEILGK